MLITYTAFPQVPRSAVQLLWVHDYCDGILSGILRYEDRLHFYELCECEDGARSTRYVIRALTDAQVLEEEKWHALFREHVGAHWDGETRDGAVKPSRSGTSSTDHMDRPLEWTTRRVRYVDGSRLRHAACRS